MDANIPLVSANLATAIIESFLYGIFFILATTSLYLLVSRRQKPISRMGRGDRSIFLTPMFLASICLFILITAVSVSAAILIEHLRNIDVRDSQHWAFTATRLFQAFVNYNGGTMPLAFYADLSQITEVVKTGFLMACLIICDAMIVSGLALYLVIFPQQWSFKIYRLWIIWNHRTLVIIFPICTLLGLVGQLQTIFSSLNCAYGLDPMQSLRRRDHVPVQPVYSGRKCIHIRRRSLDHERLCIHAEVRIYNICFALL